jgi:hypothetical protein
VAWSKVVIMPRKLWALILLASIPISWTIREVAKAAIFDWVAKRLEHSLGLEEAEMIAYISTYAIPLSIMATTIVIVYLGASRILRDEVNSIASSTKREAIPKRMLRCSFSEADPECVKTSVIETAFYVPGIPAPQYTTRQVGESLGGTILGYEKIALYRVRVDAVCNKEVTNCSGHLITISREDDDKPWEPNERLLFSAFENRAEAIAKTIHPDKSEFLDVFHITSHNDIKIYSELPLPHSFHPKKIFSEFGAYRLKIMITAPGCSTESIELLFNWTGEMTTSTVLRISKFQTSSRFTV